MPDIICINETKIDDKIHDSDIEVDNYLLVRKDRNSDGGGVAIYVLKGLEFAVRDDLMVYKLENVTIQLKIGNYRSFIVTALYRPPDKPVEYFDELESLISSIESEDKDTIMLGNTNCNFLDNSDNDTKHLKRILMTYKMTQLIKEPTRTTSDTKTLIDHIIVNKTDMVLDSGVIPCVISDHDAIYITKNMRRPKLKFQTKTITVRNFKKFNLNEFLKELHSLPFNQIRLVSNDANKMWLMWKNLFLSALNKHAPITSMRLRDNKAPYITSELKSLIRQRDYLKAKANKTGSKYFYRAFVNVRNQAKGLLHKLRKSYYSQKVEECKGDMKATWKVLKHAIKQPCKSSNIEKIQQMGDEIIYLIGVIATQLECRIM